MYNLKKDINLIETENAFFVNNYDTYKNLETYLPTIHSDLVDQLKKSCSQNTELENVILKNIKNPENTIFRRIENKKSTLRIESKFACDTKYLNFKDLFLCNKTKVTYYKYISC